MAYISAGLAFCFAIFWTLYLWRFGVKEVRSWLYTLFSTFISILLVLSIGIGLFYYQTDIIDKNRKKQLKELVSLELSDTIMKLADISGKFFGIYSGSYRDSTIITYIQPLALEEAVYSGLFDAYHTKKMLELGLEMRVYNTQVSYLLSVLAGQSAPPKYQEVLKNAIMNLEISRRNIVVHSITLSKLMKLQLTGYQQ